MIKKSIYTFAFEMPKTFQHIIAWLLSLAVLVPPGQWHREEWESIKNFVRNAHEHLSSGDTIMEFLQKHYGDEETVKKHYQANHPGEKPFEKKQHKHDIHLTDVALLYFPSVLPPVTSHFTEQNFTYKRNYTSLCVRRCVKPPEAA